MITTERLCRIRIDVDRPRHFMNTMTPDEAVAMMATHQFAVGPDWRTIKPEEYSLLNVPLCQVCGAIASDPDAIPHWRCDRHAGRNPCAVEGCRRSAPAPTSGQLALDQWLCGQHWRLGCPPRSQRRRAYHAFFRRAKRYGWTDDLRRKFWRFWDSLVACARRRAAVGHIDLREIERLFGR